MRNGERITTAMGESLRRNGYAGTGIKNVLDAADAPNGSLYHHFPGGKRELAAASLRQMAAVYLELVVGLLAVEGELPAVLAAAFDEAADAMAGSGWLNLCPVGTVAGEIADAEPGLREVTAEIFISWIDAGTALFVARGLTDDDATTLASATIGALEGAFVLARTLRSPTPVHAAGASVAALAATLVRVRA
ncbi:TetR/AcrR family transcriptional regulator [Gordonia sp. DT30]|uniref:TetR/AcrR family transcriptional regulator n=1 Tax=Gordonia sp. DT30 TaxID=3416546 RepID=UPI003CEF4CFF